MDLTFVGDEVVVEPLPFGDFIIVAVPRLGAFSVQSDADGIVRSTSQPLIMDAYRRRRLTWHDDAQVTNIVFDRAEFERTAAELCGIDAERPLRFAIGPPSGRAAHRLHAVSRLLVDHVVRFGGSFDGGLSERELYRLTIATLLDAFPNNIDPTAADHVAASAPRAVRRAREYMELNADMNVRVEDVAAAAGLSVRGLHAAFRRAGLSSPMRHLREIRMQRAHEELLARSAEETTVSAVAWRWGFTNAHRFAAQHRQLYGISPGQALLRGSG